MGGNFFGHFLFGIESRHVTHVISRGKLIVDDSVMVNVDEKGILEESHKQALRLWEML
jgi:hypothetical protein